MKNQFLVSPFFLDDRLSELEALAKPGWQLNNQALPFLMKLSRMSVIYKQIAAFVESSLKNGLRPVSIAGDCCSALGVLAGLQRAGVKPILLWLDAHGDFNTWETTPSGFLGGMPLAMAVGRGEQEMVVNLGMKPFPEECVILYDARDLDPGEKEAVAGSKLTHVHKADKLLKYIPAKQPLYVHFGTDFVNPEDAPAMSYRADGGPRADEVRKTFHSLAQHFQIAAVSLSTWNPRLDGDGRTRTVCMELLNLLIGE